MKSVLKMTQKGFTLIELLIVMAILGVLAVVVLVAINPVEQLARARDSGKVSGVQQLGRAATAYFTAATQYPPVGGAWIDALVVTQDLSTDPSCPWGGGVNCDTTGCGASQNGYCYDANASATNPQAAVWAFLESNQYNNRCGGQAYTVFSTVDARGGIGCDMPTAGTPYGFI